MAMAEDAGAADLISQDAFNSYELAASPEQVIDGWRYFGTAQGSGE